MDILGIGIPEIILIFILALMVFGPQRLPVLANRVGRKLREWRTMSQVFLVEWREELAALEEARQSLDEARQALLEAQQVVATEMTGVKETVALEMSAAETDISEGLTKAQKAVDAETAQIQATAAKVAHGQEVALAPNASAPKTAAPQQTAAQSAATDVAEAESDVSEVTEADMVIAPPELTTPKQAPASAPNIPTPTVSKSLNTTEDDVTEIKTASDIAAEVATQIAQNVATEVAAKVAKDVAAEVAEEVARIVAAKLMQAETDDAASESQTAADVISVEEKVTPSA